MCGCADVRMLALIRRSGRMGADVTMHPDSYRDAEVRMKKTFSINNKCSQLIMSTFLFLQYASH
jgi:hypothetical protein